MSHHTVLKEAGISNSSLDEIEILKEYILDNNYMAWQRWASSRRGGSRDQYQYVASLNAISKKNDPTQWDERMKEKIKYLRNKLANSLNKEEIKYSQIDLEEKTTNQIYWFDQYDMEFAVDELGELYGSAALGKFGEKFSEKIHIYKDTFTKTAPNIFDWPENALVCIYNDLNHWELAVRNKKEEDIDENKSNSINDLIPSGGDCGPGAIFQAFEFLNEISSPTAVNLGTTNADKRDRQRPHTPAPTKSKVPTADTDRKIAHLAALHSNNDQVTKLAIDTEHFFQFAYNQWNLCGCFSWF